MDTGRGHGRGQDGRGRGCGRGCGRGSVKFASWKLVFTSFIADVKGGAPTWASYVQILLFEETLQLYKEQCDTLYKVFDHYYYIYL